MKTARLCSVLLVFAAATRVFAAFESAKFDSDNKLPAYPENLRMRGITRGTVIVALSIDATGRVADSLVLGYTQTELVRACEDALKEWKFSPARLDGEPAPTQLALTVNFTLTGAVISSNIVNHFLFDNFDHVGDDRLRYRVQSSADLDRAPAPLNAVAPKYAEAAEEAGVRGKVRVHFYIDEQGAVRMPSVDSDAHPYLSEVAVAAMRDWKFEPPTRRGSPVLVAASQDFNFGGK